MSWERDAWAKDQAQPVQNPSPNRGGRTRRDRVRRSGLASFILRLHDPIRRKGATFPGAGKDIATFSSPEKNKRSGAESLPGGEGGRVAAGWGDLGGTARPNR